MESYNDMNLAQNEPFRNNRSQLVNVVINSSSPSILRLPCIDNVRNYDVK